MQCARRKWIVGRRADEQIVALRGLDRIGDVATVGDDVRLRIDEQVRAGHYRRRAGAHLHQPPIGVHADDQQRARPPDRDRWSGSRGPIVRRSEISGQSEFRAPAVELFVMTLPD